MDLQTSTLSMGTARQVLAACLTSARQAAVDVSHGVNGCGPIARRFCARTAQASLPPAARESTATAFSTKVTFRDLYKLAKGKLSLIVVATGAAGFVAGSGDSVDLLRLAYTCIGTFGCSAAANALNQVYEIRNDGLMRRTMLRPLPAGRLSAAQALVFAAVTGVGGGALLATQVCAVPLARPLLPKCVLSVAAKCIVCMPCTAWRYSCLHCVHEHGGGNSHLSLVALHAANDGTTKLSASQRCLEHSLFFSSP